MADKYQTLSIVAGTWYPVKVDGKLRGGCNAACGGCVALMTTDPADYLALSFPGVDFKALAMAANTALSGGVETVIFTGKKEPTRYPEQVDAMLDFLYQNYGHQLPYKEIQTNGINLVDPEFQEEKLLEKWQEKGLTHVSISVVNAHQNDNDEYLCNGLNKFPDLTELVNIVQNEGLTARLSVIATKKYLPNTEAIEELIDYCRQFDRLELAIRPINKTDYKPTSKLGAKAYECVEELEYKEGEWAEILRPITASMKNPQDVARFLAHDAVVYEYRGKDGREKPQNLCITDCLTHIPKEDMKKGMQRQVIYYPNGIISSDWTHNTNVRKDIGKEARNWLKETTERWKAGDRKLTWSWKPSNN